MSLKRWVRCQPTPEITITRLSGLILARFVLKRLVENGDTVEKLIQDLDGDEKYFFSIVSFLKDIKWIREDSNGEYVITNTGIVKGQKNPYHGDSGP